MATTFAAAPSSWLTFGDVDCREAAVAASAVALAASALLRQRWLPPGPRSYPGVRARRPAPRLGQCWSAAATVGLRCVLVVHFKPFPAQDPAATNGLSIALCTSGEKPPGVTVGIRVMVVGVGDMGLQWPGVTRQASRNNTVAGIAACRARAGTSAKEEGHRVRSVAEISARPDRGL